MVTNAARDELHAALERHLGGGPAQTMRALLEARLVEVRGESKADMAGIRTEPKDDIAGLGPTSPRCTPPTRAPAWPSPA